MTPMSVFLRSALLQTVGTLNFITIQPTAILEKEYVQMAKTKILIFNSLNPVS
jgi:hypothetical protein